jgi:hypothetical protein
MPRRMLALVSRVRRRPSASTIQALDDAPSVTRPRSSTNQASPAPASLACCLAMALGSRPTLLMSQRPQRFSGVVITPMPLAALAPRRRGSTDLAVITTEAPYGLGRKGVVARRDARGPPGDRGGRRGPLRRTASCSTMSRALRLIGASMRKLVQAALQPEGGPRRPPACRPGPTRPHRPRRPAGSHGPRYARGLGVPNEATVHIGDATSASPPPRRRVALDRPSDFSLRCKAERSMPMKVAVREILPKTAASGRSDIPARRPHAPRAAAGR